MSSSVMSQICCKADYSFIRTQSTSRVLDKRSFVSLHLVQQSVSQASFPPETTMFKVLIQALCNNLLLHLACVLWISPISVFDD